MSSLPSARGPTTAAPGPRLLAWRAAAAVLVLNLVTALLAMATDWRARFDPPPDQGSVSSELALNGSAISAPIAPLALLAAGALLARRSDRWGVVGLVGIAVAAGLFVIGGIGEITASPSVHTPSAVLVVAGIMFPAIGLTLIALTVRDAARRRAVPASTLA